MTCPLPQPARLQRGPAGRAFPCASSQACTSDRCAADTGTSAPQTVCSTMSRPLRRIPSTAASATQCDRCTCRPRPCGYLRHHPRKRPRHQMPAGARDNGHIIPARLCPQDLGSRHSHCQISRSQHPARIFGCSVTAPAASATGLSSSIGLPLQPNQATALPPHANPPAPVAIGPREQMKRCAKLKIQHAKERNQFRLQFRPILLHLQHLMHKMLTAAIMRSGTQHNPRRDPYPDDRSGLSMWATRATATTDRR
jgi:hypothetical protein